ncbi:hypothetical protein [Bacillus weihaiensis]|uniref:hypothetical protein n=1 Tax=Bacillus weihaiensis TaxID=1547283 RepID=UPI0023559F14|nr:hypothetical protein [Bacillus weihaiensis]
MKSSLLFSLHRALFGAIPKNLKGLRVKVTNDLLIWQAFFDPQPTEEEKEVLSVACTEVIADLPNIIKVEEEYLYHPGPLTNTTMEEWFFVRWESENKQALMN